MSKKFNKSLNFNYLNSNVSFGSISANTFTGSNVSISGNITSSTLNASNGITAGNINFTGDLYKNGSLYVSSQWTTTAGSNLSYTSGMVVITNNVITNVSTGTVNASTGITAGSANIGSATAGSANIGSANIGSATVGSANITSVTVATLLNTNTVSTNISAATLNLSTGITTGSAKITNANVTTATVGTLRVAGTSYITNAEITSVTAANIVVPGFINTQTNTINTTTIQPNNIGASKVSGLHYWSNSNNISDTTYVNWGPVLNEYNTDLVKGISNISGGDLSVQIRITGTAENSDSNNDLTGTFYIANSSGNLISTIYEYTVDNAIPTEPFDSPNPGSLAIDTGYITVTIPQGGSIQSKDNGANVNNSDLRIQNPYVYINVVNLQTNIPTIISTNTTVTNASVGGLNASGLSALANATATNASVGVLIASTGITTAALLNTGLISTANLASTTATIPNIIVTNISTGTVNASGLSTLSNVTATNASVGVLIASTGLTTGTINATGLSSLTNVTATNASVGVLVASTGITTGTINASNATVTNVSTGGLNASGLSVLTNATATNVSTGILNVTGLTTGTIKVTGISTLINVTATNISTNNLNAQSITVSNGNLVVTAGTLYASDLNMTGVITMNTNMIKLGGVGGLSSLQLDTGNIDGPTLNGNLGGRLSVGGSDYLRWENSIVKVPVAFSAGNIIGGNITTTTISAGTLVGTTITGSNLSLSGNLVVGGTLTTVNITTTNVVDTNISAGTLTSTNVNVTTSTIATLLNTNVVSTNISSATLNLSTGITTASAQITNLNVTTSTIATARITTALISLGNSNTVGNIFTTGGNVGINTGSPGSSLHVAGNIPFSPVGGGVHMGIDSNTYTSIQLNSTAGSYIDFGTSGGDYQSRIIAGNTGNLSISTNGANNNGYVGINTATPAYTLDVSGTGRFTGKLTITGSNGETGFDTATNDQYADMRVIRNSSSSLDKDMYLQLGAGATSTLHMFSNNSETMTIKSGNVGIATASPVYTLDVSGTGRFTSALLAIGNSNTVGNIFTTGGNVGISTTAPSGMLHLNNAALFTSTGNLTCTGDIISFGNLSDRRLKENIFDISNDVALDTVRSLRPVTFNWREDIFNESKRNTRDVGFIAQEVEELVPEAVSEYTELGSGNVYKNIKHERLIPYLVGAIQHLKLDVENQKIINKKTNDELQTTKDELQTTKDELQSVLQQLNGVFKNNFL